MLTRIIGWIKKLSSDDGSGSHQEEFTPEEMERENILRFKRMMNKHSEYCYSCGHPVFKPYSFSTCRVNGHLGTSLICKGCLQVLNFDHDDSAQGST